MKKLFIFILVIMLTACGSKKEININDLEWRAGDNYGNDFMTTNFYYKNSLFTGIAIRYYQNGEVEKIEFKKGRYHGDDITYYKNGKVSVKSEYVKGFEQKRTSYYENGNKLMEARYDEDGEVDGICYFYYEDGTKKEERFYSHGDMLFKKKYDRFGNLIDTY